jgi:predicted nuclease of restriction endonuclease-like RecB superfamily
VPVETTVHDTVLLRDTVISKDSLWTGEVVDSLNNVIGWLRVYYNKKIAELSISKYDTLLIHDTLYISKESELLPTIASSLSWWEQIIFYGGIGAIISLLIALRFKRGKV